MTTTVRLDGETEARIARLAAATGRSKSYYVREMIELSLPQLEDTYRLAALVERVHRGEEPVSRADEVRRRLGLGE
jgi:RHH-type transcriptional regulator, rel operon repressor / antitoxin RelB